MACNSVLHICSICSSWQHALNVQYAVTGHVLCTWCACCKDASGPFPSLYTSCTKQAWPRHGMHSIHAPADDACRNCCCYDVVQMRSQPEIFNCEPVYVSDIAQLTEKPDLQVALCLQDLRTFFAQLRAAAVHRKCPALLDVSKQQGAPGNACQADCGIICGLCSCMCMACMSKLALCSLSASLGKLVIHLCGTCIIRRATRLHTFVQYKEGGKHWLSFDFADSCRHAYDT